MAKRLIALEGNRQALDGGAMFGNCPRVVWEKWLAPDERHRVTLACRALLVVEEDRKILFETGIGTFFEPKLKDRYGVDEERHVLLDSLAAQGLTDADIDLVVLSHLHFDHAGGLLTPWSESEPPRLLFPNARFLVGTDAFERARSPHPRDQASFIPALPELLEASGRLELIDAATSETLGRSYRFHRSDGHTPGMLLTEIDDPDGPVVFAADLAPGRFWLHLPITMGFDRAPERMIEEKRALFGELIERSARLFFTHDPEVPSVQLTRDEKGRYTGAPVSL